MISFLLAKNLKEFGYPQIGMQQDGIAYSEDGKKVWWSEENKRYEAEDGVYYKEKKVVKIPEITEVLETIVKEIKRDRDLDKFGTRAQGRLELAFDPYDDEWEAILLLDEFYIQVEDQKDPEEAAANLFIEFSREIMKREDLPKEEIKEDKKNDKT